jgi:hypothetical protein
MLITGNQESGEQVEDRNWNMKGLVNTAVEALKNIIQSDKKN